MIIDIHTHLGFDFSFEEIYSKEALIDKIKKYNIDIQIVQPGTCHDLSSVRNQHNAIAEICSEYPHKFFGMANPSPHLMGEQYHSEISRCIEDLGFICIKIHPMAHGAYSGAKVPLNPVEKCHLIRSKSAIQSG